MTTKECLHRFCSDCIITALRSGNKECPTCRKKLVSKRSLRHDPNFDLLISKIYPSRDEYEAHQVRVLEKLNKSHSQAALMNSINEGIKLQSQNRLQRTKKTANESNQSEQTLQPQPPHSPSLASDNSQSASNISTVAPTDNVGLTPLTPQKLTTSSQSASNVISEIKQESSVLPPSTHPRDSSDSNSSKFPKRPTSVVTSENESENSSVDASGGQDSATDGEGPSDANTLDEIELVFMPHPTEMGADNSLIKALKDNAMRYIKTTANATVDHLSKYLATRLALDLGSELPDRSLTFCIYVTPTPGQYVALNGGQTLRQVNDRFWKVNKPLEMFYSWKKT
uniref:RING-type E3 ubiquitin transferase n=1 Tax=Clastoptera arizonana TaxID=38151 RepID=A0A1B6C636_9HEMI